MKVLTLRNITLILSIFLFLIVLQITGRLALNTIERETKVNIRNELISVLSTTHESVYIWFEQRIKDIEELVKTDIVLESARILLDPNISLDVKNRAQSDLRQHMERHLKKHEDLGIFIISPDYMNVASMRDSNLGQYNLIADQRPEIMERVFGGETCFVPTILSDVPIRNLSNVNNREPTLFIATPIIDRGEIIGVFTLRLDPVKTFTRIINLGRIGESGETYAFDDKGTLITSSRFDHMLKSVGLISPNQTAILNLKIKDPGKNLLQDPGRLPNMEERPLTIMARSAISGESAVNIDGYRDYRGVPVYGAWLWDEVLGFGLTTEMDVDEALGPYSVTRRVILIVLISIAVISILFLIVLIVVQNLNEAKLKALNNQLEERVKIRTHDLQLAQDQLLELNRKLEGMATIDSLTGLANRRSFDKFIEQEWNRCLRDKKHLTVAIADIDFFKKLNDNYGHQVGDECLKQIGFVFRNNRFITRPGDLIGRYGGEEFAFVFSNTSNEDAKLILEKVLNSIRDENIPHEYTAVEGEKRVTISIGYFSEVPNADDSAETYISRADEALYHAKKSGRNRLSFYCNFTSCESCTSPCKFFNRDN